MLDVFGNCCAPQKAHAIPTMQDTSIYQKPRQPVRSPVASPRTLEARALLGKYGRPGSFKPSSARSQLEARARLQKTALGQIGSLTRKNEHSSPRKDSELDATSTTHVSAPSESESLTKTIANASKSDHEPTDSPDIVSSRTFMNASNTRSGAGFVPDPLLLDGLDVPTLSMPGKNNSMKEDIEVLRSEISAMNVFLSSPRAEIEVPVSARRRFLA